MELNSAATLNLFESYLKNRSFSRWTLKRYLREIRVFFEWLSSEQEKYDARDVTSTDIHAYRLYLYNYRKAGKPLSEATRRMMILTTGRLYSYLFKYEYIIHNPFDRIDPGSITEHRLRESIAEKDMHSFLDGIEGTEIISIRDRALFELLYGTGIRIGEVCSLDLTDVDLTGGKIHVRSGKGNKDRIVPIGANSAKWLEIYLAGSRPRLGTHPARKHKERNRDALFLTVQGCRLSWAAVNSQLKQHFKRAGLDPKKVCTHMIRHSFATHMIEGGAGVKQVKDILGHACYESTAVYTHFSVQSLRRIMKRYHPGENALYSEMSRNERQRIINILKGDKITAEEQR